MRVKFAQNAGISAATNQALELARGEYVYFLDHDDLLHPSALEAMQEKLSEGCPEHPACIYICTNWKRVTRLSI